ncbi:hypothetical protein, partial [Streptomyces sp. NPDC057694]|uniref:hypothetical protein n=1 Tax=Streptomyces sp. NPDC057694 TaxID=3346216 RepID=UPI00368D1959
MTNDERSESFETDDDELDAGFDAVLARLDMATAQERAELRLASDRAEIGHAAYALGMHHLQDAEGDVEAAARWLQQAHDMGVPGAGQVLRSLLVRHETDEETTEWPEQVPAASRAAVSRQQEGADSLKTAPLLTTMTAEQDPDVRQAALDQLHHVMADMNAARSLADTLQTVADGVVNGLGY